MDHSKSVFARACRPLLISQFATSVFQFQTTLSKIYALREQQISYKFIFTTLHRGSIMYVIVSARFPGNNRATGYTKTCSGKKGGTSGEGAKTRRGGKDDRQGRGEKGLFSVQMRGAVTAVRTRIHTHARTHGILLISYSFLLFAPRSSRSSRAR